MGTWLSSFKRCSGLLSRGVPVLAAVLCAFMLTGRLAIAHAGGETRLLGMIGPADALVLVNPENETILQKNTRIPLIPASTLKLLTALAVMDALGSDYRFETHFYAGTDGTIRIKGKGDPLLISEAVAKMAAAIHRAALRGGREIRGLSVDDTYFAKPIKIPGVTPTSEPYDAPVGAFGVNFNTVNYRVADGRILSAEPQTPLLPFAETLIRKNGPGRGGRIVLSHDNDAIALYGAHLVAHFLGKQQNTTIERIKMAPVIPVDETRLLVWTSPFTLTDLVQKMMAFSNNFLANQLVIAASAEKYGAPGTLAKAVRLLNSYCMEKLGLENIIVVEGSGISRKNRLTAQSLLQIVTAFEPHHELLRHHDGEFYKTGTLKGISTRVGYLQRPDGGRYRFVIIVNTPGRSAAGIKGVLRDYLVARGYP